MEFIARLRRLWRHAEFRRLLRVRIAAQTGDGMVQIGMASYVLFSPQNAPNAWAMAAVMALMYLPFSIVGPFVGVVLDRWPRQRIAVFTDITRAVLCLGVGAVIASNSHATSMTLLLYALLLVVLGLNRFMLAGLGAGLPFTVDKDEYLDASSIMPMIGPLCLMASGVVVTVVRNVVHNVMPLWYADGIVFSLAAGVFCFSVWSASRIGRDDLGPKRVHHASMRQAWRGLVDGVTYLATVRPVVLGFGSIAVQRITYGMLMVATILAYRNYFHDETDLGLAMVDMGVWFLASGVGYALSGVIAPLFTRRLGVRRTIVVLLAGSGIIQLVPGSIFIRPALVSAAFLLGVAAQSVKVCVDTLVQAHVSDLYRGRVFILYDMMFNTFLVLGAALAAFVVPDIGLSLPVYVGMGVTFGMLALWFATASRELGDAIFNRGTELATQHK